MRAADCVVAISQFIRREYEQRRLQTSILASPQRIIQEAQALAAQPGVLS